MKISFTIAIPKADELSLCLDLSPDGMIEKATLTGVGGPDLLKTLAEWRPKIRGPLSALPLPEGRSTGDLLLREIILQCQSRREHPYKEEEICHCRAVPTAVVESAILLGAHTPETVSRWTSASTSCGTCRRDVESILDVRIPGRKAG